MHPSSSSTAVHATPTPELTLGVPGFSFEDLHRPERLAELHAVFLQALAQADAALHRDWLAYAQSPEATPAARQSELLIAVAPHLEAFVARLFGVQAEIEASRAEHLGERPVLDFKRDFIQRRVLKKGAPNRPAASDFPALDAQARQFLDLAFPALRRAEDPEKALAQAVLALLEADKLHASGEASPESTPARLWAEIAGRIQADPQGRAALADLLAGDDYANVSAALSLLDRWTFARMLHPTGKAQIAGWVSHQVPRSLDFSHLVEMRSPDPALPEAHEGVPEHLRKRDGFGLTDRRYPLRQVAAEVDYCLYCHERGKDSCSHGFKQKDGAFKANPLGVPLGGCPLEERISEAQRLKGQGSAVGALATVIIDNPMCAGTGHRICNDCMKACIFQKQQPVDIPQIETHILTDVLALPWGLEIYGLLQRWNPLNVKRPVALPYNGKNVLVVGLGPAGYTLAHHLLNEGFGVVAVDGLKIEPLPERLAGPGFAPVHSFEREIVQALDARVLAGFGGVSEYGITVRWDKNFLTLLHLLLVRRSTLRIYGGIRFGGTLTLDDAWDLGFHHVAIAAGAGKPTLVGMKNNLLRGVRQASDFLMALQLGGAFKKDSLANLQVQLPALVIGGGLTAIDTATELFAYYPVQVEKALERYEALVHARGEPAFWAAIAPGELPAMKTFLEHGRAIRAERARAQAQGEPPNFVPLVRRWGGVSLVYRKSLHDSPAYRLNHEEITKSLEEGIRYVEKLSPVEAVPGPTGAVSALVFEKQAQVDGRWQGTGEQVTLPARTVCVAAGTKPNVTYGREHAGTFALDDRDEYFLAHDAVHADDGSWSLVAVPTAKSPKSPAGFFTSYASQGRFVTFYGDNHPAYAGNVVKAMASAKDGYGQVAKLFPDAAPAPLAHFDALAARCDDALVATVQEVIRLTPTIVEIVVRAPYAARHFQPGQFYRLQNFEAHASLALGTTLAMEGLALTGAWTDPERGLLGTIVLEMGGSSRLCSQLSPGEPVVLMGPTGTPTEIPDDETVLLAGGGLGNAVLFSIGRALRAAGCRVLSFAGFRTAQDVYRQDDLEAAADVLVWSTDKGEPLPPRRPGDRAFSGNIVQAMVAYGEGKLGEIPIPLSQVDRVIAIGSDRMMKAVRDARHGVLAPLLKRDHVALGSINSPMQCMMKEICAQCLQRHVDPATGAETFVFSCNNQDQNLDTVDFAHLGERLRANDALEKLANLWLDHVLRVQAEP